MILSQIKLEIFVFRFPFSILNLFKDIAFIFKIPMYYEELINLCPQFGSSLFENATLIDKIFNKVF